MPGLSHARTGGGGASPHYDSALLAPLLEIVRSDEFRAAVAALGGYDVADMGRVVWELDLD